MNVVLFRILEKHASTQDLNTRVWGNRGNKILHLISFLDLQDIARKLVEVKKASVKVTNDLGYVPRDVARTDEMIHLLTPVSQQREGESAERKDSHSLQGNAESESKPKMNNTRSDRFKQLREMAQSNPGSKEVNSTTKAESRYFRAGHVAESKRKVLTEEEAELEKRRAQRLQEVASLAKRSVVQNNPLFVQHQQQHPQVKIKRQTRKPFQPASGTDKPDAVTEKSKQEGQDGSADKKKKRNSKVIAALQNKSYVSSSVFRQTEPATKRPSKGLPSSLSHSPSLTDMHHSNDQKMNNLDSLKASDKHLSVREEKAPPTPVEECISSGNQTSDTETQTQVNTDSKEINSNEASDRHLPVRKEKAPQTPVKERISSGNQMSDTEMQTEVNTDRKEFSSNVDIVQNSSRDSVFEQDGPDPQYLSQRRLSGSQKAQWSMAMQSLGARFLAAGSSRSVSSEDEDSEVDSDNWFDTQEDTGQEFDNGRSEVYRDSDNTIKTNSRPSMINNQAMTRQPSTPPSFQTLAEKIRASEDDSSDDFRVLSSPSSHRLSFNGSLDTVPSPATTPSPSEPPAPSSSPPKSIGPLDDSTCVRTGSQDEHHTYGSISVRSTSRYIRHLADPREEYEGSQKEEITTDQLPESLVNKLQESSKKDFKIKRVPVRLPTSEKLSERHKEENDAIERAEAPVGVNDLCGNVLLKRPKNSRHGKLYLRVNAVQDVLLPLPKETTFIRCVVNDERYEYISRYEVLGQNVTFDYECIIDTRPDMIITISLHVRPDNYLKFKTPVGRLLAPSKHKRESFASYVYHKDGSIGRARFALSHMLRGCFEKPYATKFDCFNAWVSRGRPKHSRQAQAGEDVLKVIGSLDIEMLYIPVEDPSAVRFNVLWST